MDTILSLNSKNSIDDYVMNLYNEVKFNDEKFCDYLIDVLDELINTDEDDEPIHIQYEAYSNFVDDNNPWLNNWDDETLSNLDDWGNFENLEIGLRLDMLKYFIYNW